jgi:hypothetical protein
MIYILIWIFGIIITYYLIKWKEGWKNYRTWEEIRSNFLLCLILWIPVFIIIIRIIIGEFIENIVPKDPPKWL